MHLGRLHFGYSFTRLNECQTGGLMSEILSLILNVCERSQVEMLKSVPITIKSTVLYKLIYLIYAVNSNNIVKIYMRMIFLTQLY